MAAESIASSRKKTDPTLLFGLVAIVFFFIASGFVSYWNTNILSRNSALVSHTHEVIANIDDLLSLTKDAETGQRGFIITGDEHYLEPYNAALDHIDARLASLQDLTADNPNQQERIDASKAFIRTKLKELNETIVLRRSQGFDAARAVVVTDRGKNVMDKLRAKLEEMRQEERGLRADRITQMNAAYTIAITSGIASAILGVILSFVIAAMLQRTASARRKQEWLQSGEVGLSNALFGEQRVEELGEHILGFLAKYVDAHAGAFFVADGNGFRRAATYGVPTINSVPERFTANDGLLGQAVREGRAIFVRDVPDGYLTVGSALGHSNPRHLVISPAETDGSVIAVIELGFIHPCDPITTELLDRITEAVGVSVKSANYREHLQNLLEETQRQTEELQSQSEELQAQSEELRVNNEELEEQSRALKESQARLEQQQAEMEQTNSQLEEQTQQLEIQRDDLTRAKVSLQGKAQELTRASQYKSDFLANMSHELRTPLNSSLILAKLLADNTEGNLNDEQVKFAQSIQSSGNDLLALINDILDLSKIEAGHMDIRLEPVPLKHLLSSLSRTFEPLAKQKGLALITELDETCPPSIETDRMRLEQILKNLLSNAIKFTEQGAVTIALSCAANNHVVFTVRDTGIGIVPEQQDLIFEAFRQADGTISRKYGGTGLGLSISRELTRLLGGRITLESAAGVGSSFTITIPRHYSPEHVQPSPLSQLATDDAHGASHARYTPSNIMQAAAASYTRHIEDDREQLNGNRTLLVIEDDLEFARILYALAHELDFQCLIATSAEEGLTLVRQYNPSVVLLDVGLPDHSGLSVLDRLKQDVRTRHIPVHVVSANDYAETALAMGAVGYMLKPVKREALADALKQLETHLAQRLRRVLIVEDDARQRDALSKLLGSADVSTVAVGSVAECLDALRESTFDCMVLDLSLPDASGYTLLETLSLEESYAFPPVIVYTGHDLSADEEQRLRRYSKSIIIKGAKSPERLLDEVTLFLHRVVSDLPPEQQRMLEKARSRDAALEGRRILVVEDDIRNVYALTSLLEPRGAKVDIARNGREALSMLEKSTGIDLVLMDVMMPEMDGLTATREIRKQEKWKKLPIIMLTAKAMKDDQERCLAAGANDYMAKPLDVEKLLSLVRVWMPR